MHDIPASQALLLLESNPEDGLSEAAARERLIRFGPNVLPEVARPGFLSRVVAQFTHPLIYILLFAAVIALAAGKQVDSAVIFGVVFLNALIGFIQEDRATRALAALSEIVVGDARVVRSGVSQTITATEVVPGDLLLLAAGTRVAADTRLIEAHEMSTDESALTGESGSVRKADVMLESETPLAERANMVFAGTLVTGGEATGVVMATGGETELGQVHRLVSETVQLETPLTRRIDEFSKRLAVAVAVLAAVTVIVGLLRGEEPGFLLIAVIALAVSAIPEGLPAAVTITLAAGVRQMARRNAIVRQLPAVETLGSTTVICTDKTGTLTENQMTVRAVDAGGVLYEVSGSGYEPEGRILASEEGLSAAGNVALRECLLAGALCNDALVVEDEDGRWHLEGDPTEGALLVSAAKHEDGLVGVSHPRPRSGSIPFTSERRAMFTLHETDGSCSEVRAKGALERILEHCDSAMGSSGERLALDPEAISARATDLASRGLRVIGLAAGAVPLGTELSSSSPPSGLTFLGFQGMLDPPRPAAVAAVSACRRAGIAVKMVTGDNPATARAIAEQVGIAEEHQPGSRWPEAATGPELADLSRRQMRDLAEGVSVFARVDPAEKLALVEALQEDREIVAMTGDGVNDAPALSQANIGVAMGRGGTDVAREAADIVLTDDNFASIEAAVEEGRRTFDNLTKFIAFALPTNLGQAFVILVAVAAATSLPLTPVQILWVNMITAIGLGLMLAFEPKEPGIMDRPPRDPQSPILNAEIVVRIVGVGALLLVAAFGFFEWQLAQGASLEEARTAAVGVFIVIQAFYLLNCRSLNHSTFRIGLLSNRWIIFGVAVTIGAQLLFTYAKPFNVAFQTAPLDARTWLWITAAGAACWTLVGAQKLLWKHIGGRKLR